MDILGSVDPFAAEVKSSNRLVIPEYGEGGVGVLCGRIGVRLFFLAGGLSYGAAGIIGFWP